MANVSIHKASELSPQTRAAVEAELGRSLDDDEEVSIMAFAPHEAPAGEARREAGRKLQEHLNRIDQNTKGVPEQNVEEALNEARRDAVDGAERARLEFAWLAENRQRYAGRWIALEGNMLLAVGDSAQEVYAAIANRVGIPLVTRVEPEDEVYFAGW